MTTNSTTLSQLQTDEQALQTELLSLATKSGVTVGDLTQLSLDSQALDTAIRGVSNASLQQAVSDVAAATAGSTTVTTASAQSEFTSLFPSSDQAAATTVYNDLAKVVTDSGVARERSRHGRRRRGRDPVRPQQPSKWRFRQAMAIVVAGEAAVAAARRGRAGC